MEFECHTSSGWDWEDIDKMVAYYPCLKDYDIKLVDKRNLVGTIYHRAVITVNSLEDLVGLSKKVGHPLVFDGEDLCIEIYDSWRE